MKTKFQISSLIAASEPRPPQTSNLIGVGFLLLLSACSTTDRLPEGETLYTGIGTVSYVDQGGKDKGSHQHHQKGGVIVAIADAAQHVKSAFEGKKRHVNTKESTIDSSILALTPDERDAEDLAFEPVEEEIEAVLAYPPNNSFFGSSRVRTPLPIGLWAYNAWGDKEKGLGRFLFKAVGSQPVLISSVSPDTRVKVGETVLHNYGFFRGRIDYDIVHHKHNSRKAKVNYYVHTGRVWRIDSIEYLGFPDYADSLIRATRTESHLQKGAPFTAVTLQNEQTRISTMLRNRGYYYYKPTFATYKADTVAKPYKVQLRMQYSPNLHPIVTRQWQMGDIHLTVLRNAFDTPDQTITLPRGTYTYSGHRPPIKPDALMRNVLHRRGSIYRAFGQEKTQELLNELALFSNLTLRYTPRDTTALRRLSTEDDQSPVVNVHQSIKDTLDLYITAVMEPRYNADLEINVTERNSDRIGPGLSIGLKKKNAFRGAEMLSFKLYGSYEWCTNLKGDRQLPLPLIRGRHKAIPRPAAYATARHETRAASLPRHHKHQHIRRPTQPCRILPHAILRHKPHLLMATQPHLAPRSHTITYLQQTQPHHRQV